MLFLVPSSGPSRVEANATSSTTIVVRWGDIPLEDHNGILEGYKVYYGSKHIKFQYQDVQSNLTHTTTLTELNKYTSYHIQVLGYTRVGDGALSHPPVVIQTHDDRK